MKKEFLFLFLVLLIGFILRLYRFDSPIADWHSWRQADTSSVSRIFVNEGFDLLHPRFHDLSNVQSGIYFNPEGYRFVEFPIYNLLQAGTYLLFNTFTLEQWGRLVSIFSSIFATIFIFLILRRHSNFTIGLLGAFFYIFLPFNIFWSRTILPDQTAIAATLGGIFFFDLYLSEKSYSKKAMLFILLIVFFAIALLLKPFTGFFFLPALYLAWKKFGFDFLKQRDLWAIAIASILPFVLWRIWILQFPEGIPQSGWLFNGSNIRFKGAFFHWIFARRLGELILGYWGIAILILGILAKRKNILFFYSFLLSTLSYLIIVAQGNVQHSYYQVLITPSIAIFLALGANFLLNPPSRFVSRKVALPILISCLLLSFAFSWRAVRDYFNINNSSIIAAGSAVDRLTPKDAKIIAPYEGDTTLLYYTQRKGWASFSKPIEGLIKMGANYLVLVNPKEKDYDFGKKYKIVEASKDYIIFDLNKEP